MRWRDRERRPDLDTRRHVGTTARSAARTSCRRAVVPTWGSCRRAVVPTCTSCPYGGWFSNAAANRFSDYAHLPHQLRKLIREERLGAVRERVFGVRMDFDHDA